MAHLTAGDITPLGFKTESTYGETPSAGNYTYYGDIREGGSITPTDNPNPYVNFRYGRREYDNNDYVVQQQDAGFKTNIEVRDIDGWATILRMGGIRNASTPDRSDLGSRTIFFGYNKGTLDQYILKYNGCKTDELRISADVPGGVVTFEETILASYRDTQVTTLPSNIATTTGPAIQWVGGVTTTGADPITLYPQSFSMTIRNNLGRKEAYDTTLGKSKTAALYEGRQEIEFEMVLWMEDFNYMLANMSSPQGYLQFNMILGVHNPVRLTINAQYMGDGQNTALAQDKQTQTVRLRVFDQAMVYL